MMPDLRVNVHTAILAHFTLSSAAFSTSDRPVRLALPDGAWKRFLHRRTKSVAVGRCAVAGFARMYFSRIRATCALVTFPLIQYGNSST